MAEYDEVQRKLIVKLVYYGPALSGKTTNLTRLHDLLRPELKGEMMVLETQNDRTLFFDLLPLGFTTPSGLLVKLKIFTVPGQVAHDSTRKAVLSRADGVAFIADSQRSQGINNGEAFDNLAENTARVGLDFDTLPLVIQFNKRDLPDVLSEDELRSRWSGTPWHLHLASALTGEGVLETFSTLLDAVFSRLDQTFHLTAQHAMTVTMFRQAILGKPPV